MGRSARAQAAVRIGLFLFYMICIPLAWCQSQGTGLLRFEVASVKPSRVVADTDNNPERIESSPSGRLTMNNVRVISCIKWAYGIQDSQISGPGWLASERYDIIAQASGPIAEDQLKLMMRSLLAERFKLGFHQERKERTVYALVVLKNGPKFRKSEEEGPNNIRRTQVGVIAEKISMPEFADLLSNQVGSPITDMTGLKGRFDLAFDLRQYVLTESKPMSISSLMMQAMEEQLGLKLQPAQVAIEFLIVDHIERTTAN
jgi:uncharacterized protein (TIGR03435 family)